MKSLIYLETTVISYLVSRLSDNKIVAGHQDSTKALWRRLGEYEAYVSDLVLQEAGRGDPKQVKARSEVLTTLPVLEIDVDAKKLAALLIQKHVVPAEYPDDAMHIATATANGMDFIVT